MPHQEVPFWQVNIREEERSEACPEFLKDCDEKDRRIIGTPDTEYKCLSWSQVKDIIHQNRMDLFLRKPSELRMYREWCFKTQNQWGSVMDFIIKERLLWSSRASSGPPFAHPDDIKILLNDWPYALEDDIVHLVVWTKFELQDDPLTGDLTAESRRTIRDWLARTFYPVVDRDAVVWFRNPRKLKSIHTIEHFHVLLNKPDLHPLETVTGGDLPMSRRRDGV